MFFKELKKYADGSPTSLHCPGHNSGNALSHSQASADFLSFFGKNLFLADACNSVDQLGQLLTHSGGIAESEGYAASVYGADKLYFSVGGTSASNRIIVSSVLSEGDIAIVDRNCHKSVMHAIIESGAIPVYLVPSRGNNGEILGVDSSQLTKENICSAIGKSRLIGWGGDRRTVLVLTQATYDGIMYNCQRISDELSSMMHAIHFDEAWSSHTYFSGWYRGYRAMDVVDNVCPIFSSQSIHKTSLALTQSSQILVKDGVRKHNGPSLDQSYLMHSTTSPSYPLIASCDMNARAMEESGRDLVAEARKVAMMIRDKIGFLAEKDSDFFFRVSFPQFERGLQIHDVTKVTITCGNVPAAIVSDHLVFRGINVEKVGLYSFLALITVGTPRPYVDMLINSLSEFCSVYNRDVGGMQQAAKEINTTLAEYDIINICNWAYTILPDQEMIPRRAHNALISGKSIPVPLAELHGQISCVIVAPYPPGIPVIMPGEVFSEVVIKYISACLALNDKLGRDILPVHGVRKIDGKYFIDCCE